MSTHPSPGPAGMVVHNTASGTVGFQAGHATGNTVHITPGLAGAALPDLHAELVALRNALTRAHGANELDELTYRAAEDELDKATAELESDDDEGTGRFLLALRRLRGMVEDVAGLAAAVTAVISTVASLR